MPSNRVTLAFAIAALLILTGFAGADPVERRIVALSGTDGPLGPGLGPGISYIGFGRSQIDEAGAVAFVGSLTGPGVTSQNQSGLWHERGGSLSLMLRKGDAYPEFAADSIFDSIGGFVLSRDGRLVTHARLKRASHFLSLPCVLSESNDGFDLAAVVLGAAPGASDDFHFLSFEALAAGTNGDLAIKARLHNGVVQRTGIWKLNDGVLDAVAIEDAPALQAGSSWFNLGYSDEIPSMNSSALIAFLGYTWHPDSGTNAGMYREMGGVITPVVTWDQSAPSPVPGSQFHTGFLSPPTINNLDHVAFSGAVRYPDGGFDRAIWTDRSGALEMIVRGSDTAPGIIPSSTFSSVSRTSLNDNDQIAFYGWVGSIGRNGYWIDDGGDQRLMILDGSHPAGTPAHERLDILHVPCVLNNSGSLGIYASLEPRPERGEERRFGLWIVSPNGSQALAFRAGQFLEVSPGDVREISTVEPEWPYETPQAGGPRAMNDANTITARIRFTDGSSAIIAATPRSFCSADTNGDGFVDFADINEVLGAFNSVVLGPAYDFDADLDFDGAVGFADLNLVISQLGDDCGG